MGVGDKHILATMVLFIPSMMIFTKIQRMDHREQHDFHMEMRRRADFWDRGNAFAMTLRDAVLASVVEGRSQAALLEAGAAAALPAAAATIAAARST